MNRLPTHGSEIAPFYLYSLHVTAQQQPGHVTAQQQNTMRQRGGGRGGAGGPCL